MTRAQDIRTEGIVTVIPTDALVALIGLSGGAPVVLPADASTTQPASPDALRERLLIDDENRPLPWFAAIWSIVARPRVLGLVSRNVGGQEFAWVYYFGVGGFVEQVTRPDGVVLLAGKLDQLAERVALAAGLLRAVEVGHQHLDVVPDDDFRVTVRFTRVGGATAGLDFAHTSGGWTREGSVVEASDLLAALESAATAAFAEEPVA